MKSALEMIIVLSIMILGPSAYAYGADKQKICHSYARKAVEQYNLAKQHNLPGIVPPLWSDDRDGHYRWCMHGGNSRFANSQSANRQALLDKHLSQKPKPTGSAESIVGNNHGSSVEATPISIPRPIQVKKQNIRKTDGWEKLDTSVHSELPVGLDPGRGP